MGHGDIWDLLLYVLSVAAAVTAIVAFLPWALEQRRRPEVEINWRYSPDGSVANLLDWPPDLVPEVAQGQTVLFEPRMKNVGDRTGESALVNIVVADCFQLRRHGVPDSRALASANATAGFPPSHLVNFLAPGAGSWLPGNVMMYLCELRYSASEDLQTPLTSRLLFEVAESRFNVTGFRLLPSVGISMEQEYEYAPVETPWPPQGSRHWHRIFQQFRWIRVKPRGRVACWRGRRGDVRDIKIIPDG